MEKSKENIDISDFKESLGKTSQKQLIIEIPFEILSCTRLSLNEKLLLGLDFSFKQKLGFNQNLNTELGKLFNLHSNIVGDCRKNLVKIGILEKKGRKYFLTDHYKSFQTPEADRRNIKLPIEIYSHKKLKTGEKLLWGEYNSISKGVNEYFAKREYTAKRLNVSRESISNWTKSLYEKGLLEEYRVISGYCTRQKRIITCSFDKK